MGISPVRWASTFYPGFIHKFSRVHGCMGGMENRPEVDPSLRLYAPKKSPDITRLFMAGEYRGERIGRFSAV